MLFDNDMMMFMSNNNESKNKITDLTNDKVGLTRGNMFDSEYKPYKNYNPTNINVDNMLLKLYELNFALIDINLYLDLHPNDNEMYKMFKKYANEFEEVKKMYENEYGPLEFNCVDTNTYEWIKNPWPWDKNGGNKDV